MFKRFYVLKNIPFLILLLFNSLTTATKATVTDSLLVELNSAKNDSLRIEILNKLSWENKFSDPDTAVYFAQKALIAAEKINFIKGIGDAGNNLGVIQYLQGNYSEAIVYLEKSLPLRKKLADKKGVAKIYNNLGLINSELGNYPKALEYHLSSLKISEELHNKSGISASYNNIGNIYSSQEYYDKALEYFLKSSVINKSLNDLQGLANNYNNIGTIYSKKENSEHALKYYFTSLQLNKDLNNKAEVNNIMINIGNIYMNSNKYSDALDYLTKALKSKEEMQDSRGVPGILLNMGYIFLKQNDKKKALDYMNKSLEEAQAMESIEDVKASYKGITDIYEAQENFEKAFKNYTRYIEIKDSILNTENTDKIARMAMQYDFDKKDLAAKAEQDIKDALSTAALERQRLIRNGFVSAFAVMLVFAGVFLLQRNRISKEKKKSDDLLLNILPFETAEELKKSGTAESKDFNQVTVLFTDFKNFTAASEKLNAKELVSEINYCFSAFDKIITEFGIEKIKTIGDSYMCAGGLPVANETNAEDTIRAALKIRDFMLYEKQKRESEGKFFFEIRIGCNTGPVVAGIVGIKKFAYDIWGDTVNIASRMESCGEAGMVNISGSTYERVKDKFECAYRGKIEAKNKGMIDMYFVEEA